MHTIFCYPTETAFNEAAVWAYQRDEPGIQVCIREVPGWTPGLLCLAVIDDFGNLVRVG